LHLPGGESVEIDPRKLVDYALSPTHPVGKHKARLFALRLGVGPSDAPALIDALKRSAATDEAERTGGDIWGERFSITFLFGIRGRSAMITAGWIAPADGSPTRLTSVYIAKDQA
jgi:hypothetical protein